MSLPKLSSSHQLREARGQLAVHAPTLILIAAQFQDSQLATGPELADIRLSIQIINLHLNSNQFYVPSATRIMFNP